MDFKNKNLDDETMILVTYRIKKRLQEKKLIPRESYKNVIKRLLDGVVKNEVSNHSSN